ncbi:MAG: cation:proton antiporter [Actinomycetota bacterium]|nr:cation:proton antiporter [Actinomycetota bacterium]MDA8209705.1 cation:proton antiporter [Actinomycetota bacterium]
MHVGIGDVELLVGGIVGAWLIAKLMSSWFGRFVPFPAMALELALGFALARLHLAGTPVGSPAYLVGEAGVVAIIAAGGTHSLGAGSGPLVRRAGLIAITGVALSIALIGTVFATFSWGVKAALVIGLALAPSSAGVASRVLVERAANHTRQARAFFVTAVLDDILGLAGLAVIQVALAKGGLSAALGVLGDLVAIIVAAGAYLFMARNSDRVFGRNGQLLAWVAIALAAIVAEVIGASPIVTSFALAAGLSHALKEGEVTEYVEKGGFILLPLFFVALGAIAGSYPANLGSAIPVAVVAAIAALIAKVVAARVGYGPHGFLGVAVMLAPRAEITFVIAVAALQAGAVTTDAVFVIALVAVLLGTGASLALAEHLVLEE